MSVDKPNCTVVFDRKDFDDLISKAKNTTESKSILPILSNFLIEVNATDYSVKATDLENYLILRSKTVQSEVSCELCLNSKKLTDIVKNLSSATFMMSLVEDGKEGSYVQIQSGRSKFKLSLAQASEFPAFPNIEEDYIKLTINGNTLLEGLSYAEYSTAKEDIQNPNLTGINVIFNKSQNTIEFASTDATRLTVFTKYLNEPGALIEDVSFTIPKKTVKILKAIVNKIASVNIYYKKNSSFLVFESEDSSWTLFSRLLEGEFPEYHIYIEQERPIDIKVNRKDLKDMIKRLSFSVDGSVIPIKLSFADNILIGETTDKDFTEGRDEIDIEYMGEPIDIGLNAKYLKEALDNAPAEEFVQLKMDEPSNGILLEQSKEGEYRYISLIMPYG